MACVVMAKLCVPRGVAPALLPFGYSGVRLCRSGAAVLLIKDGNAQSFGGTRWGLFEHGPDPPRCARRRAPGDAQTHRRQRTPCVTRTRRGSARNGVLRRHASAARPAAGRVCVCVTLCVCVCV
jgi:hypothetical protein